MSASPLEQLPRGRLTSLSILAQLVSDLATGVVVFVVDSPAGSESRPRCKSRPGSDLAAGVVVLGTSDPHAISES